MIIKWIREIHWGKALLVGVLYTVVSMVVRQVEAMLTKAGPPPPEFMITSLVFSLATGICITLIYYYLKDMLPKDGTKRIFLFADLMIAASFVFFTLPVYLLFNVPVGLLVSWFVSSFIILVVTSYAIVKIVGK
jgi:uncharacterized membrane-anchored protein